MNLTTNYLGLELRTPLVPAASPLSEDLDNLKRMEDAGAAAIVVHSVFEEQIRHQMRTPAPRAVPAVAGGAEVQEFLPGPEEFHFAPDRYLRNIELAKEALRIPIIASLNGTSFGGWTTFAREIEKAGADAIELNIYSIPTDPEVSADEIETGYLTIVAALKAQLKIPVAVKLSPFFTSFSHFAARLDRTGADGLVLFNRFYQPDIDLESRAVSPTISLSTRTDSRLPMRWIAILRGRVRASLAATSGILGAGDVLKMLMAGADVTMLCSVLLRSGIEHLAVIESEMCRWMEKHGYDSVGQLRGVLSQSHCPDPATFERAQYLRALAVDRAIEPVA
jgi:dihydroorotate dehydrogenase (fumarate)